MRVLGVVGGFDRALNTENSVFIGPGGEPAPDDFSAVSSSPAEAYSLTVYAKVSVSQLLVFSGTFFSLQK